MDIQLKEVKNRRDLRTFIRFPNSLYKGNPYWVPPLYMDECNTLRWDKNPAFKDEKARYWLAIREGKVVGRVAGLLVPKHEKKWGEKYMRFGWIDFIDDLEVVKALMGAVEGWAKEEGMDCVHGPLGFTDLDREGMLVDGFDQLATLATNYNFPYYPKHLEALGYAKDVDWVEYEFTVTDKPEEKIAKAADIIMKRFNLHMFTGGKKGLAKVAPQIFDVLDDAYRSLYGVVPLSKEQVQAYTDQYLSLAIMDLVPIVMDKDERVVAFGVTFPSFSRALQKGNGLLFPFGFIHLLNAMKFNDTADLYLIGVRDEYRGKGLNALLMNQTLKALLKHGIKKVESNPNLELNNDVQAQWKYFENRQNKRRRCYIKHLN